MPTNTNFATVASVLRVNSDVQYLDMDPKTFAPSLTMIKEAVEGKSYPKPLSGVFWVHIGGVISPEFPAVVDYCHGKGSTFGKIRPTPTEVNSKVNRRAT
ncbi:DegT/DnrJ/EryC1/StrS family aminotransferase [Synechocystis sp. B12]|nr:DegT/DnrJ/EryC1/StrS family aminotransferase [Synechocystis sp. B12]